jgi:CheY-like chemotaxis protein
MTDKKTKRILLVDDEPRNIYYLKKYLEKNNFEVHEVFSGEQAIDVLESNTFDDVITDMNMRKINGIELALLISSKYPETSTHLITADISEIFYDYLEKGILKNIVMKPYGFEEIEKIFLT